MEKLFLLFLVVAWTSAATKKLDPKLIEAIFGEPADNTKLGETTTVRPLQVDSYGEVCQCVPYYYCDDQLNAVNLTDPTRSGYGQLDIRFRQCQETTERCCKIPKINTQVSPLQPDASRLKGCGYRNVNGLDFTISGGNGDEAQFGEFPWVVAILDATNNSYYGVGVLIHPQVVMTGAHIVRTFASRALKIRAGEWDTQTSKERLPSQERLVEDIRIRKDFVDRNLHNNMALLRLAEPVQLSDHINVVCLPDQDEYFDGQKDCIANGWGKKKFGRKGVFAVILKKVELNMVSNAACNWMLKQTRLGRFFKLDKSFVCAGGVDGIDTCEGDGGAPLVCPVGDNQYKLSGLVSWGIGCGEENVPGVYTRVAMFRDWVDSVMAMWSYDTSGYNI